MTNRAATGDLRTMAVIAAVFLAVCALTLGLMPKDGFWVVDNASKYMQVKALAASSGSDVSLPLSAPQRQLDPDFAWNPVPFPFSVVKDAHLYSVFPPAFALMAVPFHAVAGRAGLLALPLIGGIATLLGLFRLAGLVAPEDRHVAWLAPALAGLCTPLWFYSLEFWEHTPAVALVVWSLWFWLRYLAEDRRRDLVQGCLLLGLAIWLRDDLALLALVVVAAPVVARRRRGLRPALLAAAVLVASLAPLWILQWRLLGAPFGLHGQAHLGATTSVAAHLAARPAVFYSMFLACGPDRVVSVLLGAPVIALLFFGARAPRQRPLRLLGPVTLAALGAAAVFARGLSGPDGPILHILRSSNAFLAVAPLVALGCVAPVRDGKGPGAAGDAAWRRLRLLTAAYALLYALAAPLLGANGIHWGNRYLLLLYPVLCLPAAIHLRQALRGGRSAAANGLKAGLGLLVVASLLLQIWSVSLLREKKIFTHLANERVDALQAPVIVTDVWWVPQELYRQFARTVFLVRSDQERDALDARLSAAGLDEVVFVTRPGHPVAGRPLSSLSDGNLRFYGLVFVKHPTVPPTRP